MIQKSFVFPFLILLMSYSIHAQTKYTDPDQFLIGEDQVPKVLLVGTFHFGYPGLDMHKTAEANKVNILSAEKQKEVKELVEYIARFKPTKIMVETGRNTGYLMRKYEAWEAGEYELRAREVEQIAFRLMNQFKLDTLYGTDATTMVRDMHYSKDSLTLRPFIQSIREGIPDEINPIYDRYDQFYDYSDRMSVEMNLLDFFKAENSEKVIRRMHGVYLLNDKDDDYNTVDYLSIWWYSRNLRIFHNIQGVETTPDDRILVLYGLGHIPILQHLFESTPEYELVEFGELEDAK